MSETNSPSLPKTSKTKTLSSEKKKKMNALLILTIVECVIIGVLSIVNVITVYELSTHDPYYKLYYFFAILGVLMIALLIVAYFKKWLGIQLLSIIATMLWSTYCGATIFSCIMTTKVIKLEKPYRESEMYVVFEGTLYKWEGTTVIYGLPAEWENLELRATITERDDSKIPTEELHAKGIPAGSMIFYQDGYKYILVEVVTGSLFEFINPDDPPDDTVSTAMTTLGVG